jgi:tetratricopeptide (TPR) repeat protein
LVKGGSGSPKKVDLPDRANFATPRDSEHKLRKHAGKIGAAVNNTIIKLRLDSKNTSIALSFGFVVITFLLVVANNSEIKITQQDKVQEIYLRAKDKLFKKNIQGAIQDLTTVIQLNPKHTAAYIDRGLARGQVEDHEGAIQDFTEAISLDSNNFGAYSNRCGEYRLLAQKTMQDRVDKLNNAKKDCDTAISLSARKYANAFLNRAVIFAMLDDRKRAISDFEYAKQISLGIQNDLDLYNRAEKELKKIKLIDQEREKVKESEVAKCFKNPSDTSCNEPPLANYNLSIPYYDPSPTYDTYDPPPNYGYDPRPLNK